MESCWERPLIVQSDRTVLLEANHRRFQEVRDRLSAFAELVKCPDHIHTYRITSLSMWNAAAAGMSGKEIVEVLTDNSKFPLPLSLEQEIEKTVSRYGQLRLKPRGQKVVLTSRDGELLSEVARLPSVRRRAEPMADGSLLFARDQRGPIKQELIKYGYPVDDRAGYTQGEPLPLQLRNPSRSGAEFVLRDYQKRAVEAFYRNGSPEGGNGVLVLPCGAGKTIVGLAALERVGRAALILAPNTTSVRQWIRELLDKTDLSEEQVGEYTGSLKEVKPVTVATYQILTHRASQEEPFTHMELFHRRDWGLILYDEVHLLPAPVFRATADLQARRRLGLTATLVREDGREEDVFSLIGPKIYDVPWKELEEKGWIAGASCTEIRTPMAREHRHIYAEAGKRKKYRIAAENPDKLNVLESILQRHEEDQVLVIGQYLSQLKQIAERLDAPLITGKTGQQQRERLYRRFRKGEISVLVVSKVANFAVDLPDARVAVQISGTFGSRQEEAQRLGRILRPKKGENQSHFYHIVTRNTVDQDYALNRQLFLVEQGYRYTIVDAEQWELI
ncbi:DNA repair helicase XPB [Paludifilum halophilum]|uniref:DNA 3'-5' helicase n=1 Tax=Paludifilum halophilum TaxID=1642702 RepID=A0A235B9I0_9BACL|nr:DNA repair helicase XPB [Paludifilum halophilum]OYD08916.1 helicase [Paludifilum halophilum]